MKDETVVKGLAFLCRAYDNIVKAKVSIKNRCASYGFGEDAKYQDEIQVLEKLQGQISRKMEKDLALWPVWSEWLKNLPGIGAFIGANLILLYYYKMTPVCPKCNAKLTEKEVEENGKTLNQFWCPDCERAVKGDGNLSYRVDEKDFPHISGWWKYMGRHVIDGQAARRKKGVKSDWSTKGKVVGFQVGEQFNRQTAADHPYKAFLLGRKAYREGTHPDASKGKRHAMALNETIKLFLSHFWIVARVLDSKSVTNPWIIEHGGHRDLIYPFFMSDELEKMVKNVYQAFENAA